MPDLADKIHAIEHEGDQIAHEIVTQLHMTFVTPIERTDITALGTALDDVLDLIDDAARRLVLYKVAPQPEGFAEIARLIHEAAEEIRRGVSLLRDLSQGDKIRSIGRRIHDIERRGDEVYYRTLEGIYGLGGGG